MGVRERGWASMKIHTNILFVIIVSCLFVCLFVCGMYGSVKACSAKNHW